MLKYLCMNSAVTWLDASKVATEQQRTDERFHIRYTDRVGFVEEHVMVLCSSTTKLLR